MVLKGGGVKPQANLLRALHANILLQCLCNSHGYPFQLKCFRWSQSMVVLKTVGGGGSDAVER